LQHILERTPPATSLSRSDAPREECPTACTFLQWTSSQHDQDWHTLSLEDGLIVLQRLAALEQKLLYESEGLMPPSEMPPPRKPTHGFVSIIKNYGQLAGGSLAHGHQQIGYSNIMPSRFYNNWRFSERHQGDCFSRYLLGDNPSGINGARLWSSRPRRAVFHAAAV
jgi:galactose-1-phosphate uridylyltransferase